MQYSVYAVRCGERIAHLENGVRDGLTGMDAHAAADRLHAERGSGLGRTVQISCREADVSHKH